MLKKRISCAWLTAMFAVVVVALSGCGQKEEPPAATAPVAVAATQTPAPSLEPTLPEATPTVQPVKLMLPSWLEGKGRSQVVARARELMTGYEVQLLSLDSQIDRNAWDVALMPLGAIDWQGPRSAPWISDALKVYANPVFLTGKGILKLEPTWRGICESVKDNAIKAGASQLIALAGDMPGLPRTLQVFAAIHGATSGTDLESPQLRRSTESLYQLFRAGQYKIGNEGFASARVARIMAESLAGATLGWETELSWITDPARSPSAERIQVSDPQGAVDSKPGITRLWCWVVSEKKASDASCAGLVKELAKISPEAGTGGVWVGDMTDTAKIPPPSDLFSLENLPGQDYRDTNRIIEDTWKHGARTSDVLRSLRVRFNAAVAEGKK